MTVYIHKKGLSKIHLTGNSLTLKTIKAIKKHFSYKPEKVYNAMLKKYEFKPRESLFDSEELTMSRMLLQPLAQFLKESDIPFVVSDELKTVNKKATIDEWYETFKQTEYSNKFDAYPHQLKGIYNALARKNCFLEIATSGGKSFIAYAISMILAKQLDKRILIITDTATLVNQLKSDFLSYSVNPKAIENKIRRIHSKSKDSKDDPVEKGEIVISTYKSMATCLPEYFQQFDVLIVDEAHKSLAPSIQTIIQQCAHCEYIIGMSGKIKTTEEFEAKIMNSYGQILKIINAKELIQADMATPLEINVTRMRRPNMRFENYNAYIDYICEDKRRIHYIVDDAMRDGENLIILFNRTLMGKNILEMLKQKQAKRKGKRQFQIEYIDGEVNVKERDRIKQLFETNDNVILVASYKTIATGVNAPNLRGIVIAEPMKSELTIIQAIGRTIRLNKGKELAKVYDYADSFGWGYVHLRKRLDIYDSEGHTYKLNDIYLPADEYNVLQNEILENENRYSF